MMRVRTMRIGLAALALFALALNSCTRQIDLTRHDRKPSVAFIVKTKQGEYWNTVKTGAEAAAKEFNVELTFAAPDEGSGENGQLELIQQSLKNGAAALVLAANDYAPFAGAVEKAGRANIPVITVDTESSLPYVRSYIGADNYGAGRKAGEKLIELAGERSRVAVISYVRGSDNTDMREKGLLDELAKHPQVELVAMEQSTSDRHMAAELTRRLLAVHKKLDVIVVLNVTASVGVADELDKMGLGGKVKIVSFDSTPESLERLQEGLIQATIVQNPFSMGYLGIKYSVDALNGKKIPQRFDTGTKVIDRSNMFWSDNQKLLFPFVK